MCPGYPFLFFEVYKKIISQQMLQEYYNSVKKVLIREKVLKKNK